MARRKTSEFERLLIDSAEEALAIARGELAPARVTILERTARDVEIAPPPEFNAKRVQRLRKRMKLSQTVFAGVLNVSPSLVRAWERGARDPDGAPQRLLQVAEKDPNFIDELALMREKHPRELTSAAAKIVRPIAAKKRKPHAKRSGARR